MSEKSKLNFKNPRTQRIPNPDRIRTCYIMYKDLPIATLTHEYSSISGDFDWIIAPIWKNWEECYKRYNVHIDIAGIDDTLKLDQYVRRYNPEFVTQRTIPPARTDLFPLLRSIGLHYNDLFEVMCRTHAVCGNDDLYVSRTPEEIIDVYDVPIKYTIPDFDTSDYGWILDD